MLRNQGPNMPTKTNKYPLKTKHSISLSLSSPRHTQQLYHTETLYLPGYITQGAVPRVIKDTNKTYCAQILLLKWDVARE
jgi:hypothetical protein